MVKRRFIAMSDLTTNTNINHHNLSDDTEDDEIRNDLAKAYQQSVDILSSLVDNLLTAGIIDLKDNSYTVLKDMTGKTTMNARHSYEEFFRTWMKPFLLEECEEGLRFSDLSYLTAKFKENKKVTKYKIKTLFLCPNFNLNIKL